MKPIHVFFLSAANRYRTASSYYPSWVIVVKNGVSPYLDVAP